MVWVVKPGIASVLLVGIAQWIGIALVIAVVYCASRDTFRTITGRAAKDAG